MHKNIAVLIILGLGLVLTGCEENRQTPKITTVELAQSQAAENAQDQELGNGVRIKFINATKDYDDCRHQLTILYLLCYNVENV